MYIIKGKYPYLVRQCNKFSKCKNFILNNNENQICTYCSNNPNSNIINNKLVKDNFIEIKEEWKNE